MIIGKGMIATAIPDHEDLLFFAAGVSDSSETDPGAFRREADLFDSLSGCRKKIIYFSTCDFYDDRKHTAYLEHKCLMEQKVRSTGNYLIFRISQVIGNGHCNNLLRFLASHIRNRIHFDAYMDYERNLIPAEMLYPVISCFLRLKNETVNIANTRNILVSEIIRKLECFYGKGNYTVKPGKNHYCIPLRDDYPKHLFDHEPINLIKP